MLKVKQREKNLDTFLDNKIIAENIAIKVKTKNKSMKSDSYEFNIWIYLHGIQIGKHLKIVISI